MHREYGGYLPFEIEIGGDYFSRYGEGRTLRTNSAKAALYFALLGLGVRKLYAPHYMCASMNAMFRDAGIDTEYYFLNDELLPDLPETGEGAAVLLVNYFGVMEEAVKAAAERWPLVLLDQSHAFFSEPLLRTGSYNIYSCRKFFGVPDGGYLIGELEAAGLPHEERGGEAAGEASRAFGLGLARERDRVSRHFSYLTTSLEYGTNAAYAERQASDRYFRGHYRGMSTISRSLLSSVDYGRHRALRCGNFRALHEKLGAENRLRLPDGGAPAYVYPFWPEKKNIGSSLKKALVAEKIYVPTMWRELVQPQFRGTVEYALSEEAVFLPIDQRYGTDDMEYLAARTLQLLGRG